MTDGLRRSVLNQVNQDPTLQHHHRLHFVSQTTTDTFRHPFQSSTFTVREFQEGDPRLDLYLSFLAGKLNSNESFDGNTPLYAGRTFIRTPAPGRGHGKRFRPATAAVKKLSKRGIVTITNNNDLCCARAIVTTKALADGGRRNPDYENLRRLAKELHRQAGVPEGLCGLEEVAKFQSVLPDYKIKVMTVDPLYGILFKGPQPSDKHILLVKSDRHYDGCNSFAGFLSRSRYCHDCDKGYDHDSYTEHPCEGKWCT